jgi:hypothetical protein
MWLKHIALPVLFGVLTASAVSAQTHAQTSVDLEEILKPGMTIWITDSTAREEKRRIVDVSADAVTAAVGEDIRRFAAPDISLSF